MRSAADAGHIDTLRIERSMAGLAQLGDWVDTVTAALGLGKAAEYAVRLCVEEATVNVVMHGVAEGAADNDAGFVVLRVEPAQDALRVTVEDRCGAFDPLHAPPPEPPIDLETARVGGLGIHLMRQYARAISYERAGDTNRLTLTIAR
ncbi:MAG TPA: ATP-binding protein [Acetobacteraceae bacterium]|nr:ATP-binding protein [Acetobacteraceae bacterium]